MLSLEVPALTAPELRRVLVIDGEMPLVTLQERLGAIVAASDKEPPDASYVRLIAADHQQDGIPDLSTREGHRGHRAVHADGVDLVILDNLSTLCRPARKTSRRVGARCRNGCSTSAARACRCCSSIMPVGGAARHVKREDVLDTVINLVHPEDYQPDQGARFEVHFEKLRGSRGDSAKPFEAKLDVRDGQAIWTMRDLEDVTLAKAAEMFNDRMTVKEVAAELGISKSSAGRLRKKCDAQGLIDDRQDQS
jgi:putative DNA primase/helicase